MQPSSTSPALQWPDGCVSLYQNVVPGDAVSRLFKEAPAVAECPNFWTPKEAILAGPHAAMTLAEAAVSLLYHSVMKHQLKDVEWSGAEWWTQVYEPGKGLAFHFDKDETVMEESGDVLCPIFSSVYYLSDDPIRARLGATVVLNQTFDPDTRKPTPESPDQCALVFPRRNSYCVFHGGLAHGVLDAASQEIRATLLVNWWASRPKAVSRVTPQQVTEYGLSSAEDVPFQDPPCESEGTSMTMPEQPSATKSVAAKVTVCEAESQCVTTIDELLHQHSISLHGEGRSDVIVVDHKGMSLMPLTEEQLEGVEVGAALVPLAMLLGSDEDEERN